MSIHTGPSAVLDDHLLNDGTRCPAIGFGVFQLDADDTVAAVTAAVDSGYRLIDTASAYGNEAAVGAALSGRDDIAVTTKLWNDDQGYDATLRAFDRSAALLGRDTVDTYLVHWPRPRLDRYVDSWRAMAELVEQGRIRSVGVSNFSLDQIDRLTAETGLTPAVNQVEVYPGRSHDELRAGHAERGVRTQAWSPLGRGQGLLEHPTLRRVAAGLRRTPAQVVLRWHVQLGVVPLPRSRRRERIAANLDVAGFVLDDAEMAAVHAVEVPPLEPDPSTLFDIS